MKIYRRMGGRESGVVLENRWAGQTQVEETAEETAAGERRSQAARKYTCQVSASWVDERKGEATLAAATVGAGEWSRITRTYYSLAYKPSGPSLYCIRFPTYPSARG